MTASLTYVEGNATEPEGVGKKIIPHIVNDSGIWGSGFVIGVSDKWPSAREDYLTKHSKGQLELGNVDFVEVEQDIIIANMCAQARPGGTTVRMNLVGEPDALHVRAPIRYGALARCMAMVRDMAWANAASIHAPMFGAARAGGNWSVVEHMILELWVDKNINVTVYQYKE